ncbi:SusD family outer membrane lipoprotein NanU [Bacteroides congonensis]|jgi:hypothetical protein|uniref:SusD family outer membrane lipoprotein NanU n=2 Tax=Bacteroides congonensis TaxID=1871006 RepID=UPI000932708E|nr:SusD family outer membrane lipoprotein NanU [Bacteroides congonensis]
MKNIFKYLWASAALLPFLTGCNSLDLESESTITDANYWKSDTHFSAFNVGLHAQLRERSYNFFILGEPRADIYGDAPFGGEATQGMEIFPANSLNRENVGLSNFANLYGVINQINLMIAKTEETGLLPEATKKYYLGEAYGMRAFLYFHLLRSWGDVILHLTYTSGSTIDLANIQKAASPATEVMARIKEDITASETAFNGDYSYKYGKHYWSLGATKMLKGEVYLWSGKQMGGGDADYRTAKGALQEVNNCPGIGLEDNFTNVFAYANKKNKEIIFTIHNGRDEYNMWGGTSFRNNLVPQQAYMTSGNYFDENGVSFAETKDAELNGLIRLQIKKDFYDKVFREGDTRKAGSVKAVYVKEGEDLVYRACFPYKFQGTMLPGGSERAWLDDYPIYRYADCLLLLAEAKALLGEDITTEINTVRKRAYGETYFEANKATVAYPNEKGGEFYSGNPFVAGDDDPIETVLKERLRELMYEGKRWYDIRTLGCTAKYSTANQKRLLWPIDANTLTNNRELVQTEGYLTGGEGEE